MEARLDRPRSARSLLFGHCLVSVRRSKSTTRASGSAVETLNSIDRDTRRIWAIRGRLHRVHDVRDCLVAGSRIRKLIQIVLLGCTWSFGGNLLANLGSLAGSIAGTTRIRAGQRDNRARRSDRHSVSQRVGRGTLRDHLRRIVPGGCRRGDITGAIVGAVDAMDACNRNSHRSVRPGTVHRSDCFRAAIGPAGGCGDGTLAVARTAARRSSGRLASIGCVKIRGITKNEPRSRSPSVAPVSSLVISRFSQC